MAALALLYMLAWTVLPALLAQSFPLDVAESLSWGKEWQWGYYKHPPLAPIVLHLSYVLLGKFGPYLLSQLCIALTLWAVWHTGLRLMEPRRALLGTVLTMCVAYYSFPSFEYNHNIAQMPIWAALGACFVAALQDGKMRHWLALGMLGGLGMLTKYSVAVMLLAMGLYLLCSGAHRKVLRTPGPWLAVLLMAAIFAPHLWWLHASDWLPFAYASERSVARDGSAHLQALEFPLAQLAAHLPLLAVFGAAWWHTRHVAAKAPLGRTWHTRSPWLLLTLALLPALIVSVLGVALGLKLRDMWGSPMWAFSGLLAVACVPGPRLEQMQRALLRGTACWLLLVTALLVVYLNWGAQLRQRPARTDWPATAMAQQAQQTWQQVAGCPLDTVAGDYWLAGILSAGLPERPSVLIDGDPRFSPWISPQRLQQHGALWIWHERPDRPAPASPPQPLASASRDGVLQHHQGVWQIAWPHAPQEAPLTLHWHAYVPPGCQR